ncbi:GNAT family N-acetyltransferase [Candidatus Saccharibacteria bacterium]|jgi:GNAT superfamily N-acetyltransferase|nr:GNAT family N-acetyltransferase [Candidatus Saccharibacteria bacterium]
MEREQPPKFTISVMTLEQCDEANAMRLQSWLDTYVNDELGVTREWIERRNAGQTTDEVRQRRMERLADPSTAAWVATDDSGRIVGMTTPYIDEGGRQHVGSLYVDKDWHGKGVGGALMQKVVDWFDSAKPIELGVAAYNERAKAFYRKWGFVEVEDSETLFDNKIPEIMMVRQASK